MNPEFIRNWWLEMGPRRLVLGPAVLALVFFTSYTVTDAFGASGTGALAESLFLGLVVLWGTWKAASSVVGEIRDKTWDQQRLSAIAPWTMVIGKLFGATVFVWYCGLICLAVYAFETWREAGAEAMLYGLAQNLTTGLAAHSVALFASLLAARRRQTGVSRLEVFIYTVAGFSAAYWTGLLWQAIRTDNLAVLTNLALSDASLATIIWWGRPYPSEPFLLVTLAVFIGWALIGCQRAMRIELLFRNSPLAWLGFVVFLGVFVAGFDLRPLLPAQFQGAQFLPWAALFLAYLPLVYASAFIEPKDKVQLRWIGARLMAGRIGEAFLSLPAYVVALAGLAVAGIGLSFALGADVAALGRILNANLSVVLSAPHFVLAWLGFVVRDVGIFVMWHALPNQRRGDLAAVITLAVLWVVLPALLGTAERGGLFVVLPYPTDPALLGPLVAWGQAIAVWAFAISQLRLSRTQMA